MWRRNVRDQPDHRLAELAGGGSEPAFSAIVVRYRDELERYSARMVGSTEAEDVVQETFIKAHAALLAGGLVDAPRAWLYQVAHNTAVDSIRHPEPGPGGRAGQDRGGGSAEAIAESRADLHDVIAALHDLPDGQRDAIVLRELEGRSYDEIAGRLGITPGAVGQLLRRARVTLRGATQRRTRSRAGRRPARRR
jgi:RNA polymerase sigma factor (sigma-70 family)